VLRTLRRILLTSFSAAPGADPAARRAAPRVDPTLLGLRSQSTPSRRSTKMERIYAAGTTTRRVCRRLSLILPATAVVTLSNYSFGSCKQGAFHHRAYLRMSESRSNAKSSGLRDQDLARIGATRLRSLQPKPLSHEPLVQTEDRLDQRHDERQRGASMVG
jgi:hypothetical protein